MQFALMAGPKNLGFYNRNYLSKTVYLHQPK